MLNLASFWKPKASFRSKIGGKWQNWNVTFWVIFKHCVWEGKQGVISLLLRCFVEILTDRCLTLLACECTISECLKSDEVLLKLGPPEVWNLNDPMHQSVDKNAFSMSDSRLWCQYCALCQWTFGLLPHQFLPRKSFPRHKVQGHQMNFTQFAVGKKVSSSHYLRVFLNETVLGDYQGTVHIPKAKFL